MALCKMNDEKKQTVLEKIREIKPDKNLSMTSSKFFSYLFELLRQVLGGSGLLLSPRK